MNVTSILWWGLVVLMIVATPLFVAIIVDRFFDLAIEWTRDWALPEPVIFLVLFWPLVLLLLVAFVPVAVALWIADHKT